ncbi:MAG: UbiX family flavin prenyltransferase [Caldimicrobium sp.]|jgi:4-hydroxy-3-polyprenylbenzoate decarboxylase
MAKKYLIGITGASGAIYALTFVKALKERGIPFEIIVTEAGKIVIEQELELSWKDLANYAERVYEEREIWAPPASGSASYEGLIIIPCSMGTLAGIASGQAKNLLLRAADVMLKERRSLVLVVRETPLNLIHLQNMLAVTQAGGVIFPAMPGFYHKPKSLEELVEGLVLRLLQFLNLSENFKAWKGLS